MTRRVEVHTVPGVRWLITLALISCGPPRPAAAPVTTVLNLREHPITTFPPYLSAAADLVDGGVALWRSDQEGDWEVDGGGWTSTKQVAIDGSFAVLVGMVVGQSGPLESRRTVPEHGFRLTATPHSDGGCVFEYVEF